MREPSDYEESGPGMRSFGLNSSYAHWVLGPEPEGTVSLRVPSKRELAREANGGSRPAPEPFRSARARS
jgi:hypothetical protein